MRASSEPLSHEAAPSGEAPVPSGAMSRLRVAVLIAVVVGGIAATAFGAVATTNELTYPKAAVLGVVEGVTEFLPISSTGHLVIAEQLLGIGQTDETKAATDTYTIAIQIGAIIAVLFIFWRRCISVVNGLLGRDHAGRRTLIALVVAFLPAAVIGKLFDKAIEQHLLAPVPVAIAWIVGGIVILVWFRDRAPDDSAAVRDVSMITPRQALLIGCAQSLALWPGVSRSLVTIIGALLLGVSMTAAVEFSFLLGLITLTAATAYSLASDGGELVDHFGTATPLFGLVVAGIAAFASVKWMVGWLDKRGLGVFGWYRIAAGTAVFILIAAGTRVGT